MAGSIHRLKAELLREGLIGKPGFLFFSSEHANTGFALFPGISQTIFHQQFSIPFPLVAAGNPQAIYIIVVVPKDGNPRPSPEGLFNKTTPLAFNFLKTWPSLIRPESHCRFASTPGWGARLRIMQHKCSLARLSAVKLIKSVFKGASSILLILISACGNVKNSFRAPTSRCRHKPFCSSGHQRAHYSLGKWGALQQKQGCTC